jgi:hypothetical protein
VARTTAAMLIMMTSSIGAMRTMFMLNISNTSSTGTKK